MTWVGSRRMVTKEFDPEIDPFLREYRGPGVYKSTRERIAPLDGLDFKRQGEIFDHGPRHWVETEEDFDKIWEDGKS